MKRIHRRKRGNPRVTAIPNRFLGPDTMNSVGTKFNN